MTTKDVIVGSLRGETVDDRDLGMAVRILDGILDDDPPSRICS